MLDFSHVPSNTNYIQRFEANSPTAGAGWYTWVKPRGIQFVHFTVIAGGSGGSSAVLGNNSTSAGGGGGGSGAYFSGIFPAISLPDILYISVGFGGLGGAARVTAGNGVAGLAGIASYISIAPNTTVNNLLCIVNGGGVANAPIGASVGTGAVGGSLSTAAQMPLVGLGTYAGAASGVVANVTFPGNAGTQSGGQTVGINLTTLPTTGICLTGGTGGGGVGTGNGNVGGAILGAGAFPTSLGGLAGGSTSATGGNGSNGFQPINGLFYFYGATGGASGGNIGGNGGTGGNGAYGCGGGGGGGANGLALGISGAGGRGGNGLVIASCW